jgi:CubicO group peptidase (beta-lactamase class C family)
MNFPLASSTPSALGFAPEPLDRLAKMIEGHIRDGRYPGAQIELARRGKLALVKTFGDAAIEPSRLPAADDTLWLLYSNTKVITACAVWLLVERGLLRFTDTIAQHVPGFEANGKGDITLVQVLTHQGGFPNADVPKEAWEDHELLRRVVCNFTLEFTPGTRMHYHGRAAHWTAAVLVEALTKQDYRTFIRDNVVGPLGLAGELFVGLPEVEGKRAVDMHEPSADGGKIVRRAEENNATFRRAGTPGADPPEALAELIVLIDRGTVTGPIAATSRVRGGEAPGDRCFARAQRTLLQRGQPPAA